MAKIGFIGVGNMGGPMVVNLLGAGHEVAAFDMVEDALAKVAEGGATAVGSAAEAASGADVVVTMLPAGEHTRDVYTGAGKVMESAEKGALLIDSSTIDVATARDMHAEAETAGFDFLDAPVSGGVGGAEAGTLTFMCGGSETAFERAKPFLEAMGKNIFLAGGPGNGQAAKMCNNMMLAIQMIAVSEGFKLADAAGLDRQKLYDIASTATSSCWALNTYCPVPGPVPTSPANNDYKAGFTAAMMLKDLKLSQDAAGAFDVSTAFGAKAAEYYQRYCDGGDAGKDFSGIINMIREDG
ncbi:MAG: 3-hydroxyisobutyrate dehydrogenase [Alphaproteobacteria bacterium]|jgi:3-hydroxyisobutyrate dehydrogenase|nr:3-hydroxyisobutyrate dehydrogenase [Alphaproteobacteria bacterium]